MFLSLFILVFRLFISLVMLFFSFVITWFNRTGIGGCSCSKVVRYCFSCRLWLVNSGVVRRYSDEGTAIVNFVCFRIGLCYISLRLAL